MVQHLGYLLRHEGDAPLEDVHEVRQQVRVLVLEELLDVESVVLSSVHFLPASEKDYLEFYDCALVVVEVAVVGSRKDSYHCRELLLPAPVIHLETVGLSLVGPDHRQQTVLVEEILG